jgi:hypothetical protein
VSLPANSALYIITIVRMRHHQPLATTSNAGPPKARANAIIRCLKRYIAREIYSNLPRPATAEPQLQAAQKAA